MSFRLIRSLFVFALVFVAAATMPMSGAATDVSPDLFGGLQWRNIGPFHGGRIASVTGAIGQPGVFYVGTPAGGIWKTTSAGVTWFPIFDQFTQVDSIGAIQVAPSDPNIVYAGTGDSVQGSSRRRHVQVHRRRQDVDAHRPRGDDEDQQDRRRSEGSESRRRLDAGRRAAQRPGHLSHDRRRQDVGEHAASGERERHARSSSTRSTCRT